MDNDLVAYPKSHVPVGEDFLLLSPTAQAHAFLAPLLGSTMAPTLFALALLFCGLNSTITATLAGQSVVEGFLNLRTEPWVRRLGARMIAISPAVIVTNRAGEEARGPVSE